MVHSFRFSRKERLSNSISFVLKEGMSIYCFPIQLFIIKKHHTIPQELLVQVAINVSKRLYKKAHQRNRIKRVIKEGYRLQKNILYNLSPQFTYSVFVLYKDYHILPTITIHKKIQQALQRIVVVQEKIPIAI